MTGAPIQVTLSSASLNPGLQLQETSPLIALQIWSQTLLISIQESVKIQQNTFTIKHYIIYQQKQTNKYVFVGFHYTRAVQKYLRFMQSLMSMRELKCLVKKL